MTPEASWAAGRDHETVSMAFSCEAIGGRVRVAKSDERTYDIVGKREQQTLRVCNGPSDGQCRELQVHKFKFDCAGKPVEWIDAAAAAVRGLPWKATLRSARMTLHYWPDGPGAAPRLPLTLPARFAPSPPGGLHFSMPEPPRTGGAEATDTQGSGPRSSSVSFDHPPRPTDLKQAAKQAPPQPTEVISFVGPDESASDARDPSGGFRSTAAAVVDNASTHDSWWRYLVPSAVPNELLACFGIVALLLSATAVVARQQASHRVAGEGVAAVDLSSADAPFSLPINDVPPPSPPGGDTDRDDMTDPVAELASALRDTPSRPSPSQPDWEPIVEMRATAETLLDLVRGVVANHVPEGAVRDVLIADLSVIAARLDGSELAEAYEAGRVESAKAIYTQAILDLERARTLSRIEHERALQVVKGQGRSPATVEEACDFLGINPRASEAVVKKVVDALRQNWHPDLASDEADRRVREERIKAINAAWDLIRVR